MAKVLVKNQHQKDMCCDEIGLSAQNINTVLGAIVNTTGKVYVNMQRERKCPLRASTTFCIPTLKLRLGMLIFGICND
jgi:hypothetical protein